MSFFNIHVTRKKLPKRRSYKKFTRLTLMKLTPTYLGFGFRAIANKLLTHSIKRYASLKNEHTFVFELLFEV